MRDQGQLTQWQDERGFGFITPHGGGQSVFVHVSACSGWGRRPVVGDLVSFERGVGENGKPRAARVLLLTAPPVEPEARKGGLGPLVALAFLLGIGILVVLRWLPGGVLALYAGLSAVTFGVYAQDKAAARSGRWRVPERTLQSLALCGGWPGALIAQAWLRHKSVKRAFQREFRVVLVLLFSPWGQPVLAHLTQGWQQLRH